MIDMLTKSLKRVKAFIIFTSVEPRLHGSSIYRNSITRTKSRVPLLLVNPLTPTDFQLITFDFCYSLEKGVNHEMIDMLTESLKRVKAFIIFTSVEPRLHGSSIYRNSITRTKSRVPLLLVNPLTPTDFHFPWGLAKSGIHCSCFTTKFCCSTLYSVLHWAFFYRS